MLEVASDLLTTSYSTDLEVTHQLVSIPGSVLLSNLLVGSIHQDCQNPHCSQEVWKKQAVTLIVKNFDVHSYVCYGYSGRLQSDIRLVPRHLLSLYEIPDPVELMSVLTNDCRLHPRGVNVHIGAISQPFLPHLCTERLALDDSGLSLPTEGAKYTSIVNSFLESVVSLRLQCDKYSQIGLLVGMIKAALSGGRLKHLMCVLPDLYMDVVDSLCTLFTVPSFEMLSLELSDAYPLMFSKLLRAFVTAPCQHTHKLLIYIKGESQFPMSRLTFGLQLRSNLPPLKKLSLDLDQTHYKVQEFAVLCDAVFSLPQLENLHLILGKGYADMLRNQRFEDELYRSWNMKGGGIKLISISLQGHADNEFSKVKLITHTLSFCSPKMISFRHEYYFLDDDDSYLGFSEPD